MPLSPLCKLVCFILVCFYTLSTLYLFFSNTNNDILEYHYLQDGELFFSYAHELLIAGRQLMEELIAYGSEALAGGSAEGLFA